MGGAGLKYTMCCSLLLLGLVSQAQAQAITIDAGILEGRSIGGVERYSGIPFAAPPVGKLRWKAPQKAKAWAGVYRADAARPACAQIGNYYASNDPADFGRPFGSEDCLYLNIWAPARGGKTKPVLLFIHGGSGIAGSGTFPAYDGARLAAETGAIVATTNYRLGFFGSIHLPALRDGSAAENSGSLFLLDLIQALDWVQQNISAFGGDPRNVTIMGHSAGGVSVFALLRSPLALGKFHKAVVLSGLPFSSSLAAAQARSHEFLKRIMMNDRSIVRDAEFEPRLAALGQEGLRKYLQAKSMQEILAAAKLEHGVPYVADGTVLPAVSEPDEPVSEITSRVPVMLGTVRNEASMLLFQRFSRADSAGIWNIVAGKAANGVRSDLFGPFGYIGFKIMGAFFNRWVAFQMERTTERIAAQAPAVYRYEFDWNDAPPPWRDVFGSYHGLDVPFMFGNFIDDMPNFGRFTWTAGNANEREKLHRSMVLALRRFIESGDPGTGSKAGDTDWPQWSETGYIQRWTGRESSARNK